MNTKLELEKRSKQQENKVENKTTKIKKILRGIVVSNKMNKTIVVEIARKKLHKLYKKYIIKTKKVKAHDEKNECNIGDLVRIIESRPLSKQKCWRLLEIVEKTK